MPDLATLQPGDDAPVDPAEAHYLLRVLRLAAGAPLEVIDGEGGRGEACLLTSPEGPCRVRLVRRLPGRPRAGRLTVAVSAPKGPRLAWLVEKLTELGVAQIDWLVAERSQPHSRASVLSEGGRLGRLARAAARQAGVGALPRLVPPTPLARWLEQAAGGWICTPSARPTLPAPLSPGEAGCVMVGPEGGWSPGELQACLDAGMRPLALGACVLRVETAALVAAARLLF